MKTGNVRSAGTDANVHCKIFGSKGDTGIMHLKTSEASSNKFERNRTDVFTKDATDIGKVRKKSIPHIIIEGRFVSELNSKQNVYSIT